MAQDVLSFHSHSQSFLPYSNTQNSSLDTVRQYYHDGKIRSITVAFTDKSKGFINEFYANGKLKFEQVQEEAYWAYQVNYYPNGNIESQGKVEFPMVTYEGAGFYTGPTTVKRGVWKYYNKKGRELDEQVYKPISLISIK
ncbi:toxin-antitoxin system YwqK family antitoxin [Reichenbachiella versicolor]|uniref:hypothetical protein n=1 Tax=Reichenbachiella versicolor TaxID=1821036 RepID=UPI0013A53B9A|nr:hypothetical protein [Reichenbachiella versicolor]